MLAGFRSFAASKLGKVVFILVLIAFGAGFWYVGSPVSFGPGTYAVRVGDVAVPPQALSADYQRELERLQRLSGNRLDAEQARALGLPQMVIAQIVNRALVDLGAADLGLAVGDAVVRRAIEATPAFRGPAGGVDRDLYAQILRASGLSERQYEERVRRDIAREHYLASLGAGVAAPVVLAEALFRHRNERRVAEVIRVDVAKVDVAEPDEAALRAHYAEHARFYVTPEYRQITAVVLGVDDVAAEITPTLDELRAAYDEHAGELASPERRTLEQMVLADEASARRAHDRLRQGADFATVAKDEAGLDAGALSVGTVSRGELLPELAAAAFALDVGGFSAPVRTPLGWYIVQVTAIEPPVRKPFEEVRDELARELSREKAVRAVFDLSKRLEDALGGGVSLEEAAMRLDLPLVRVDAVDAQGLDPSGVRVPALAREVVATAFATDDKAESLLTELGADGNFIVRVDAVIPPAARPFEAVRDDARRAVIAERRARTARERAAALAESLRGGAELATLASEPAVRASTSPPVARTGAGAPADWAPALTARLFELGLGETAVVDAPGASVVLRLKEVTAADPAADPAGVAALRAELAEALEGDLLDQLVGALRRRHPVEVNTRVVDALFQSP